MGQFAIPPPRVRTYTLLLLKVKNLQNTAKMYKSAAVFACVLAIAMAEDVKKNAVEGQDEGRLYFTGPGYTINLIPQAILLGLLSFLAVYFLGIDLFGTGATAGASGYGAPQAYGAPAEGYDAPARYYDTYDTQDQYNYDTEARKK